MSKIVEIEIQNVIDHVQCITKKNFCPSSWPTCMKLVKYVNGLNQNTNINCKWSMFQLQSSREANERWKTKPTLFPFPIFDYNKSSSSKGITSKKESSFGVGKGPRPSFWTEIGTITTTTANGTEEIENFFSLSLSQLSTAKLISIRDDEVPW